MNPEITRELLAAAPVGSTIRSHDGRVIAVKMHDAETATPWLRLREIDLRNGWADDGDMATVFHGRGDRLVWPADTTAQQRIDAAFEGVLPEPTPEGGFRFPAEQRERIAAELLSLVESIHRSGQTTVAYGVRISHPDRTEAARLADVVRERDELQEQADGWSALVQHPALRPAFDDGDVLMPALLRRLDQLVMLEGASRMVDRMRAESPSAREWAEASVENRAQAWAAMPLTELQRIGAMLTREHDDAIHVTGRLRDAREHLTDLLHTAAESIDPRELGAVSPIKQTGRYVP